MVVEARLLLAVRLQRQNNVWALVRWGRGGVRSTEFGGVLSSEVSMYYIVLEECSTFLASGSDSTWVLPVMFGLHNMPSAHTFPFVKQDRSTCRRYMRTVYCQNGEQVSRMVLTLRFQLVCRGPPGSWHGCRLGSDRSGWPTTLPVAVCIIIARTVSR